MALRNAPQSSHQRRIAGPIRLYLDDLAHIVSILEERGEKTTIKLGREEARVADTAADLRESRRKERHHVAIVRDNGSLPYERTTVVLDRNLAYALTSTGTAEARVIVDRVADYAESCRTLMHLIQRYTWVFGGLIGALGFALFFVSPWLGAAAAILYALFVALVVGGPSGVVVVPRNRADAAHLSHENRRLLLVGALAAIPAALIGAVVSWLLTR